MNVLTMLMNNRLREFGKVPPNQIYMRLNQKHKDDFEYTKVVDDMAGLDKKYDMQTIGGQTFTDVQYSELSDYFQKLLSPYCKNADLNWDEFLIDIITILHLRSRLQFVAEGQRQGYNVGGFNFNF